jgi:hypothetical protein
MYVILIFLVSVLCFKVSSLFEDLASMKKTLSISVGLNSHACNGQDLVCSHESLRQRESESQPNNTHRHSLSQESGLLGTYNT